MPQIPATPRRSGCCHGRESASPAAAQAHRAVVRAGRSPDQRCEPPIPGPHSVGWLGTPIRTCPAFRSNRSSNRSTERRHRHRRTTSCQDKSDIPEQADSGAHRARAGECAAEHASRPDPSPASASACDCDLHHAGHVMYFADGGWSDIAALSDDFDDSRGWIIVACDNRKTSSRNKGAAFNSDGQMLAC
jgi:hypothetical protein